jgi:hypothetical protein
MRQKSAGGLMGAWNGGEDDAVEVHNRVDGGGPDRNWPHEFSLPGTTQRVQSVCAAEAGGDGSRAEGWSAPGTAARG